MALARTISQARGARGAAQSLRRRAQSLSKAALNPQFRMPETRFFFDRELVTKELDRTTRRAFIRIGGFIRKSAQFSIRPASSSASARPGKPPKSRTGVLRKGILFSYDRTRRSVVIGPVYRSGVRQPYAMPVPHVLEFGGRWRLRSDNLYRTRFQTRDPTTGRFLRGARQTTGGYAGDTVKRHKHPYMGPALKKATKSGKLKTFFRDIGQ